jgi:dystonin
MWHELYSWLVECLESIGQDISVGNQPEKIKKQINKHREFHRNISLKQPMFDITMKLGKKIIEKCDVDNDRHQLQDMLNELKNKWQSLCYQSIERQKMLEDSLLCSGQFRDALQALIDWLVKTEEYLDENKPINGDLDCVLNLIDENKRFQNELHHKMEQVNLVRKAANDIISNSTSVEDGNNLKNQLVIMNDKWDHVTELSYNYATRLEGAVGLAREFHKSIKARLDWLNNTEQQLKYMPPGLDNAAEICEAIEQHQGFKYDIKDQEVLLKQTLDIGEEILKSCVPEAIINVKHCIAVLQQRWEEMLQLCDQKGNRLNEALNTVKENEALLSELLVWVQGAEATLIALDQKPMPNSIEQVEILLQDHQEFQNEMTSRQTNVEKITKNNSIRDDYMYSNGGSDRKGSKTYE